VQSKHVIGIGNGTSTGGGYSLNSNVGDISGNSTDETFSLQSGFFANMGIVLPTVTTNSVSNIKSKSAVCGGNIISHGGGAVTQRGVCWSTSSNPTIFNDKTSDGTGTGSFSSNLTGLVQNTQYYVRAYATNSSGTSYGEERVFKTLLIILPEVVTKTASSITDIGATFNGDITNDGNDDCLRGFYFSSAISDPLDESSANSYNDIGYYSSGTFSSTGISGLTAGTLYYVRAYARNSAGISYGGIQTFTTKVLTIHPPMSENLALWLDPADINGNDLKTDEPLTDTKISEWVDKSMLTGDAFSRENAVMDNPDRQPIMKNGSNGINSKPAIAFINDGTEYGKSSILVSPYHKEITTDVTELWKPEKRDKSLFVVFKTGNSITGGQAYYERDHRETIFEAGGPLSGFNIYINEGMLCFGMWNRFERKYLVLQGQDPFYPLSPDNVYLASLEYNSSTIPASFRAIVSGYMPGKALTTIASPPVEFSGLSVDAGSISDGTGIGGATRTSFHDYNIGSTYSNHFGGLMGDIMLYNDLFHPTVDAQQIYDFLTSKYGLSGYIHPKVSYNQTDWKVIEEITPNTTNGLSEVFPNPFSDYAILSFDNESEQSVKIELTDLLGNHIADIFDGRLNTGKYEFKIDGSNLTTGIYIYKIISDKITTAGKLILNK
jgi:hypothetical protein